MIFLIEIQMSGRKKERTIEREREIELGMRIQQIIHCELLFACKSLYETSGWKSGKFSFIKGDFEHVAIL